MTNYDGEAQSFRSNSSSKKGSMGYRSVALSAAALLTVGAFFLSSSSSGGASSPSLHEPSHPRDFVKRSFQDYKKDASNYVAKRQNVGSSIPPVPLPSPLPTGGLASGPTSGGVGDTITLSNGETFTYNNTYGGTWTSIPGDFSARPQSDSPSLNETWDFNTMRIHGVNLGGWLVTEPFIVPNLYIPYQNATPQAVDEYTLSQALGTELAEVMINHYETFITEQDFAQIAGAGLNWIRLPVPFWIVETVQGEPYLEGVAWNYMIQAFEWARKYGLRVELDLHTVPGSQNGLNHSGRLGSINFLNGVMGVANAQRALNTIRVLTETISTPEFRHVMLFNLINEPYVSTTGKQAIGQFYLEAYEMIRNITGIGAGMGPYMVISDGFVGLDEWTGFLSGADRLSLEFHYYFAFSPDNFGDSFRNYVTRPCQWWAAGFNQSTLDVGLTIGGEWSLAPNDCGLWLNAVGEGAYYDGTHSNSNGRSYGSCDQWTDVSQFSNTLKQQLRDFTLANMDTFQNFMFWTWKTQRNLNTGLPYNPLWCYSCGLEYNYVPANPRDANGACNRLGNSYGTGGYGRNVPLTTTYQASQTGGTGTVSPIAAAQTSQYGQWPPASITNIPNAQNLPRYTPTGQVPNYPTTVATPLSVIATGNPTGTGFYTSIAGCSYMNPYSGLGASVPASACTGTSRAGAGAGGPATTNVVVTSLATPTAAPSFA